MRDEQSQNMGEDEERATPAAEKESVSKWKRHARKLVWLLRARYPNFVPDPYGEDRDYTRKRDAENNIESALDDGVSLQLGCIMVSEIFGPCEIETLYNGLKRLGWDNERFPVRDGSNIDWLKKLRLYGSEGTLPLDWIYRADEVKKYVGVRYTADYPKRVRLSSCQYCSAYAIYDLFEYRLRSQC